ncbi:MAG TPA: threonine/serine dehydratase, partial [Acidimicrobiia bacterium]
AAQAPAVEPPRAGPVGQQTAHRVNSSLEVSMADVEAAAGRIAGLVRETPVAHLGTALSPDYDLTVKLDHLQVTGSFKPRGAFSVLTTAEIPVSGVVAASGGNFGIAVAYAASRLGYPATIFVPESSPEEKIGRIGSYGADVRIIPGFYDDAREASVDFAAASGAFTAHAYDQHEVVAGQGTLARELEQQCGFDVVLVAVGGGGLIAGMASWLRDRATMVAVEPERCPTWHEALIAGEPVDVEVGGVAASSLGARRIGEHPWAARTWIDDSVLVGEEEIVEAQRWLWSETRLLVEPAAATTVAALRSGVFRPPTGARVVAVLSGGNVAPGAVA